MGVVARMIAECIPSAITGESRDDLDAGEARGAQARAVLGWGQRTGDAAGTLGALGDAAPGPTPGCGRAPLADLGVRPQWTIDDSPAGSRRTASM
ncbi:hypothetical protein ACIPSA_25520 [Streptomyces sp. NPDC086549]|uniref:hypothetical protein n=1 Tax=Streptomyces sp. NPDC086549 TaxID=3365752 RepID=UPI0037FA1DA8